MVRVLSTAIGNAVVYSLSIRTKTPVVVEDVGLWKAASSGLGPL
jgi:hypothetical protein